MTYFNCRRPKATRRWPLVVFVLLLPACSGYRVTLNERDIYRPPPLFSAYQVEDPALAACVGQTIIDQKIRRAEELTLLSCTHAGIFSLVGIHTFSNLRQLNLADNNLQALGPLQTLQQLRNLSLQNNRLLNINELLNHPKLRRLDLSGNGELECNALDRVHTTLMALQELILPEHCEG